jgi:hypothetical protein
LFPDTGRFDVETIKHQSGKISTKIPPFHLIPRASIAALASRFDRGVRLKGDGAWNAISPDQKATMEDRAFLIDRLGHAIDHAYAAIGRLTGTEAPLSEDDVADGGDAGAIMFAGALLAAVGAYERKPL